jgi:hypothetical protein
MQIYEIGLLLGEARLQHSSGTSDFINKSSLLECCLLNL